MAAAVCLAIAGAGIGIWLSRHGTPVAEATDRPLTVVPLTTEPGLAVFPTFSPDGSQVAYEWDQGKGEPRIFVKLIGPGEPVRLPNGSAAESCPVWSPDGKFIVFSRAIGEWRRAIFLVPALGGTERKLSEFDDRHPYFPEFRPHLMDWTPDSKRLVLVMPAGNAGFSRLFVMAIDTGEISPLGKADPDGQYRDRDPAVSPDGKSLVFTREAAYGASDLQLVALNQDLHSAGEPRPLTSEGGTGRYSQDPVWTADGREVIYGSNRDGGQRLWRIGLQSGASPQQVNSVGPDSSLPAISRQGRLVFSHGYRDTNIWRQELAAHSEKPHVPESLIESTAQDSNPQYSPDGAQISFQSSRSGSSEIWICGSDGKRCRQLTSFNGPLTGSPRWSPDATKIAFDSAASGSFNIYVSNADGGSPKRLTHEPVNGSIPSWSSDGKWIYFSSLKTGRNEIWKVPGSGGTAIQVTRSGAHTAFESPDGRHLYYTRNEKRSSLFRSGLDGSGETEIAKNVMWRGFAPAGANIFYLAQEDDKSPPSLRSLEVATGKSVVITTFRKGLNLGLSISPDRKFALYTQVDREGGNLMLIDNFR